MSKYQVLKPFYGIAEDTNYVAGDIIALTDERAQELLSRLEPDSIVKVAEKPDIVEEQPGVNHAELVTALPTEKSKVTDIKAYLEEHGIAYSAKAKKDELLALID